MPWAVLYFSSFFSRVLAWQVVVMSENPKNWIVHSAILKALLDGPIHPSNRILYDSWTLHPFSPALVPNLWHWDPNTWLQRMCRFWSSTNILMVTWWMKNSISLLTSILGKVKKIYICHLDAAYEWNMIHNLTTLLHYH